jgi:putative acetyltransferase
LKTDLGDAVLSYEIRKSNIEDGDLLVAIWRSSVAATHSFVSRSDLAAIDLEVQRFLPSTPAWIALDQSGQPLGFMCLSDGAIEALFVSGDHRGIGVGRALVEHAIRGSQSLRTVVNEQNNEAVGFYRHLGFVVCGHSSTDEQGRQYPVFHLKWDRRAQS